MYMYVRVCMQSAMLVANEQNHFVITVDKRIKSNSAVHPVEQKFQIQHVNKVHTCIRVCKHINGHTCNISKLFAENTINNSSIYICMYIHIMRLQNQFSYQM